MSSYNPPVMDDFDSFIDFNGGMDVSSFPDDNHSFSGPSHEYDLFRQQTSLPTGAVSNVSAYNDATMDRDLLYPSSAAPDMDFNSGFTFNPDFEATPRAGPAYLYPASSNVDDFSNPAPPTLAFDDPPPAPVRMYPGVHSQQAEQARISALARQPSQRLPGQHVTQHRLSQPSAAGKQQQQQQQQQLLLKPSSPPHDAVTTDRRISEILDGMRHKSSSSNADDDDDGEAGGSHSGAGRFADDMDEDERLLASEEGKKLSSKERRQLRNKVSARAFRSRRKEYISQLEGDLATKANETGDLRLLNRKLLEENNQLKNLTRTLLSHPAFHTFLEDMSRNQTFLRGPVPQSFAVETLPSNATEADVKLESDQSQHDAQINMAHLPETNLDFSALNLGRTRWAMQSGESSFQQPQVYSVLDLPKGPTGEEMRRPRMPTDKDASEDLLAEAMFSVGSTAPAVTTARAKCMPAPVEGASLVGETSGKMMLPGPVAAPDASLDLYDDDCCAHPSSPASSTPTISPRLFKCSPHLAPSARLRLIASTSELPEVSISRINQMFDAVEARVRRIEELTSHLPRR